MDKYIEFVGAALAAVGFGLLGFGYLGAGFIFGLLSCAFLLVFFYEKSQYSLLTLQAYFTIINIIGIYNNF